MSFILDALKKSETDRQRQVNPEAAFVPASSAPAKPQRWPWILAILLGANMLVLVVVLLKPTDDEASSQPVVNEAAPANTNTVPAGDANPDPSGSRPAPESRQAQVTPDAATEQPIVASLPPSKREEPVAVVQEDAPQYAAAEPVHIDSGPAGQFKTFNEARIDGMQMGDLLLELHVFSDTPSSRFVFINMRKYREGDTLDEGPILREIRTDGALLEYDGTDFILPRE